MDDDNATHPAVDDFIKIAFSHQKKIEFDNAPKRFLSISWAEMYHEYSKEVGSQRTGVCFISALIKKMWGMQWVF
eukprot:8716979-Ditylum_brightwellii.AAC.1